MTVSEAIAWVKKTQETILPDSMLAGWLAELDGRIMQEDYLRREVQIAYDPTADAGTVLLLKPPYDAAYGMWLLYKIYFFRGEYADAENMQAQYEALHGVWLQSLLQMTPRDPLGRPMLMDIAMVRKGSDGVVHMWVMLPWDELTGFDFYVLQGGESKIHYDETSGAMEADDRGWVTVHLAAEDTKKLTAGAAQVVTRMTAVDGRTYESDAVQLRVLKSLLEEVTP